MVYVRCLIVGRLSFAYRVIVSIRCGQWCFYGGYAPTEFGLTPDPYIGLMAVSLPQLHA